MNLALEHTKQNHIRLAIAILFWPAIIGLCFYLNGLNEIYVEETYKFWACAHIFLHSIPIYLYAVEKKKKTNFPFIEILAGFNIVHFGLPVFFIELPDFQLGYFRPEGLSETFICYLIFYSTYLALFNSNVKIKAVEFVGTNTTLKVLKYFGYLLLLCYLGSSVLKAIYHIGYVGFYVYIGIFINLWKEKLLKLFEKTVLTVFILYEFFSRALGGLLSPLALLVLFIILCIVMSRASKWFIVIVIGLFIWFYSIFSNIKFEYRNAVWFEGGGGSLTEKVTLLKMLYDRDQLRTAVPVLHDYKGKDHFLWRFSYQSSAMSLVLDKTPAEVPYWGGESYVPLFSKFVPRFVWKDKPEENMGYKFGVTYNVIRSWNITTSINTPILPELYMNFGFVGLYFGCILLGLLYFLLTKWFNSTTVSYASKVIGMSIIFPLMIWESNFSLSFGNLILITFVFFFLYRVLVNYVK